MNPTNVIEEGNARLKEIFAKHREFELIEEKIRLTEDVTSVDVETISACTSMITAYLSYLSGIIPKYTALANSHYIYRKFSLMWEWNKLGDGFTGKKKDNEALDRTEQEHKDELIMRYIADYLKNKYESYERHVSILQSRLGILRNQMFRNE